MNTVPSLDPNTSVQCGAAQMPPNLSNDNFGEGTCANNEFNGMSLEDYVNQVIQDFEASLENFDALSD